MMVVDSSALVAILEEEPEAETFLSLISAAPRRFVSAVSVYETGVVISCRRGQASADAVTELLDELGIETVPFTEPYISAAVAAYSRYGKGIHPKARLNLGDCAAYALARGMNLPLLFKGGDFSETDVAACL